MSYEHILACVDLAAETDFVMQAAQREADEGTRTSMVYVMELPVAIAGPDTMAHSAGMADDSIYHELRAGAREKFAEVAEKYAIASDNQHMPEGKAAREIHRLADELSVDLIVIGSHGRHGLQVLLGSTANAVLHGASCDVLAVRLTD